MEDTVVIHTTGMGTRTAMPITRGLRTELANLVWTAVAIPAAAVVSHAVMFKLEYHKDIYFIFFQTTRTEIQTLGFSFSIKFSFKIKKHDSFFLQTSGGL